MYYDDDNVATLIIREVFPEDAGTFTCVAKNAAGFASSTTELVVEAPLSDHGSDLTGPSRKSLSRYASFHILKFRVSFFFYKLFKFPKLYIQSAATAINGNIKSK